MINSQLISNSNKLNISLDDLIERYVRRGLFVDEKTRNVLCDALGDRMSLIHEYVRNKVDMEQRRIIRNLLGAGNSPQKIAKDAEVPLSTVKAIERTLKSKK